MSRDDLSSSPSRRDGAWGDDAWSDSAIPGDSSAGDEFSARSERRRARHRDENRRPPWALVVSGGLALVLGLGAAAWALLRDDEQSVSACPAGTLRVSVSPDIAEAVDSALTRVADGDECTRFSVSPESAAEVAQAINEGDAPAAWIPDSSTWVDAIDTDGSQGQWIAGPSVASSPVVLAARDKATRVSSWSQLLNSSDDLQMANPDVDSASRLAFHASRSGQPDTVGMRTGSRLIVLSRFAAPSTTKLLSDHASDPSGTVQFPVSEQAIAAFDEEHPDSPLRAVMPENGTLSLDYPWITNPQLTSDQVKIADKARAALASTEMRRDLARAGFRSPDGSGGPEIAGQPAAKLTEMTPLDRDERLAAAEQWHVLRTDMRMLPIIDVSGSMAWPSTTPGMTRFEIAQGALRRALQIIPAGSQVGAWIFSSDQGGKGVDHKELAPIMRLDAKLEDGGTHRDRLAQIVDRTDRYVKGDTGLYDSVWAGYQKMLDEYDPDYVNSVVVITDGENDDPNGGLNLRQLLDKLDGAYDPEKPVRIITIGMGEANPQALQQIADESGGSSYIAETPDDIQRVFVQALLARRS